ncbi:hypothetical protein RHSIM_Rhsim06G0219300 [Rhododendron simsii]|uniref:dihydrolipoyllysine-residue succinyltransferase n=1 Tax=Rhododendron simsii TaxID=118357 RepID=A0A834GYG8_RHOSS|nr:hypothetical protein RHSIM_Rhsim06G0219300 [Rhododendron simsii]
MAGGSFTISNGGVYGSLLSTPIINPPQIALTYDHRLIDAREAAFFLHGIKDVVEVPRWLLLDIRRNIYCWHSVKWFAGLLGTKKTDCSIEVELMPRRSILLVLLFSELFNFG